jgi:hypothetical protein
MKYAVEMAPCDMIYIPSFIKIAAGVQAILKSGLRNLRSYNAGIIDGRNLRKKLLRWDEVP